MRKLMLFAQCWLVCLSCVQAQWKIGAGLGATSNKITLSNSTKRPFTSYAGATGFVAQLMLSYRIHPHITAGIEPSFINKSYSLLREGYYTGVRQDIRNSYIQMPLVITGLTTYGRLSIGISIGGYMGYWLKSVVKGKIPNLSDLSLQADDYQNVFQNMQPYFYKENYRLDSDLDRRWESGWLLGTDFHYNLTDRSAVFIAPRYYYSLIGQVQKRTGREEQRYNQTFMATTGIVFKITPTITQNE